MSSLTLQPLSPHLGPSLAKPPSRGSRRRAMRVRHSHAQPRVPGHILSGTCPYSSTSSASCLICAGLLEPLSMRATLRRRSTRLSPLSVLHRERCARTTAPYSKMLSTHNTGFARGGQLPPTFVRRGGDCSGGSLTERHPCTLRKPTSVILGIRHTLFLRGTRSPVSQGGSSPLGLGRPHPE